MIKNDLKIFLSTTLLFTFFAFESYSQEQILRAFSMQKSHQWQAQKKHADSISDKHQFPKIWTSDIGQATELQGLEHGQPLYYQTENINASATISSNRTWQEYGFEPGLSGQQCIGGIWDGGYVFTAHQEFLKGQDSRVSQHDEPSYLGVHATHLSGMMIAKGVNIISRGMANSGRIFAYDFNNDIAEMASEAADGLKVSNHSYGPLCGWAYNSSDDMWYWHGNLEISTTEDPKFGLYTEISHDMDFIAFHAPEYLIVKSAGNDRNDEPEAQPIEHYIWDGTWKLSTMNHDADGGADGFDCLSPMAIAKNVLTIGAVEDLPDGYTISDEVHIATFSSFGPTDDGRIKPDLVANGTSVLSCGAEDDTYLELSGTSMSTASISGSILLLNELQETLQPGLRLKSSTLKALLIHTADECGPSPGPDYMLGWGLANIYKAANLIKENYGNGGKNIYEASIAQGEVKSIPISISDNTSQLMATIGWTDPPADIPPYSLNNPISTLVNNLDIKIIEVSSGKIYYPWILDPSNPSNGAIKDVNNIDNLEQVLINAPNPGEYVIQISHQDNLQNNIQAYSLIVSGLITENGLFPPENLAYYTGNNEVHLIWEAGQSKTCDHYNIYRDGLIIASTTDLFYNDQSVQNEITYNYFITAAYPGDEKSISTNIIKAKPLLPKSMPYTMNCESGLEDWRVKADVVGWRLGDSDSLNSYYLNFSSNTSNFFGIDSYTAGDGVHVSDMAISPPIDMANFESLTLSFDYMLITGLYGTTNYIHVCYRQNEAADWIAIADITNFTPDWTFFECPLPSDAAVTGVQFGFKYDDNYIMGMGAGLDNIQLSGTFNITKDISLESISLPISPQCYSENTLDLSITIKNTGNTVIPKGDIISINAMCNGITKRVNFTLTENLTVGSTRNISYTRFINPLPPGSNILSVSISWIEDQDPANNAKAKTIVVTPLPEIVFLAPPEILCENSDPITITVTPTGGIFESDYMTGNQFDPTTVGDHKIIYTYVDEYRCQNADSITIEVIPIPEVSFTGLSDQYCVNESSSTLNPIPEGGIFSGSGVTGLIFNPELSGEGSIEVSYLYTDENGCSNSMKQSTIVHDTTDIEIKNLSETYCEDATSVPLLAIPEGGTFYINNLENDQLSPVELKAGQVEVVYIYVNENHCSSTYTTKTEIIPAPETSIYGVNELYCLVDDNYELTGSPEGGQFILNDVIISQINPMELGAGNYELAYYYTSSEGCTGIATELFEISANPEIIIKGLEPTYCPNSKAVHLEGIPSGGYFEGPGVNDNIFSPEILEPGNYIISYYYNLNGCDMSTSASTTITQVTDVSIEGLQTAYCPDDSLAGIEGFPLGGSFVVEPIFEELPDANSYHLYYTYTDENNCPFSDTATFQVYTKPEYMPPENFELMVDETKTLDLTNSNLTYVLPGGSTSNSLEIIAREFNVGENTLPISILDAYGCLSDFEILFTVIGVTSQLDIRNADEIRAYPNPANGYLTIEFPDDFPNTKPTISLTDLNGKLIEHWKTIDNVKSKIVLNVSLLNSGIYLLKVSDLHDYAIEKISVIR